MSWYTTAIVSLTACLVHAPKKCTRSANFQFDILKSPSEFKILSARELKALLNTSLSLQQVFTLGLVTSCVNIRKSSKDTTTAHSHENVAWKSEFTFFSVSIVIIPTRLLCQMQANSSGAEFLTTISTFMKRMNFVIACLRPSQNMKLGIFTGSRAVDGKEMCKKA